MYRMPTPIHSATRGFDRRELIDCVRTADACGYDSFWMPEAWERELKEALTFETEHLSLYQLTIEAGTAYALRALQAARISASFSGVNPDRRVAFRSAGRVSCQASVSRTVSSSDRALRPWSAEAFMPVSEPPASSPCIGPQGAKFISSGFIWVARKSSSIHVRFVSAPVTLRLVSMRLPMVIAPGGVTALNVPSTRRSTKCGSSIRIRAGNRSSAGAFPSRPK